METIATLKDVTAFLTARLHDDLEGAKAVLNDDNVVSILIGVTDFALAMVKMMSGMIGSTPEKYLESMGKVLAVLDSGR